MNFTAQPEPATVKIVKKFYANAKETEGNSVWVCSKLVNVGRNAINAYYGLETIKGNGYIKYL